MECDDWLSWACPTNAFKLLPSRLLPTGELLPSSTNLQVVVHWWKAYPTLHPFWTLPDGIHSTWSSVPSMLGKAGGMEGHVRPLSFYSFCCCAEQYDYGIIMQPAPLHITTDFLSGRRRSQLRSCRGGGHGGIQAEGGLLR